MNMTPIDVAADLDVQAHWLAARDPQVARSCRDCARMIRAMASGTPAAPAAFSAVHQAMIEVADRYLVNSSTRIAQSLLRGMITLQRLRTQARDGAA